MNRKMKRRIKEIEAKFRWFHSQGRVIKPLTNDFMFKKTLTEHPDFLKLLLYYTLQVPLANIGHIRYLNPELLPDALHEKTYILDLFIEVTIYDDKTRSHHVYMVYLEMHSSDSVTNLVKMSVYGHRCFSQQPTKGSTHSYKHVKDIYCIGIFKNKVSSFQNPNYCHTFRLSSIEDPRDTLPGLRIAVCELGKLSEKFAELLTHKEKFIFFFRRTDIISQSLELGLYYIRLGGVMAEVMNSAMKYSMSEEYQHMMNYARKEREVRDTHIAEAAQAAEAMGEARGKMEGRAEGRAEGKLQAQLKLAQNLLSKGFEPAEVAKLTDLDINVILK